MAAYAFRQLTDVMLNRLVSINVDECFNVGMCMQVCVCILDLRMTTTNYAGLLTECLCKHDNRRKRTFHLYLIVCTVVILTFLFGLAIKRNEFGCKAFGCVCLGLTSHKQHTVTLRLLLENSWNGPGILLAYSFSTNQVNVL